MAETFTSAISGPDGDASFRSRLSFDLDVDICVVGAGLAGLTVALEAARLGASVAVLEGRHVGWNASGHQLGTVMPGYGLPIAELIERVGLERCARIVGAVERGRRLCSQPPRTEEAMPGILLSEGALEVSNVDAGETLISRLQTLSEDFETEVEGWQVDRVREQLGTGRYFHGIHYPRAFQIDGRKYVHGLAAQARRAGARIFEDTPVVSIDSSGIRKRIVTPSARLRASHIVLAGNVHLGAPLRRLSETLLPVWRYAAVTEPLGERLGEVIAFRGSVADSDGIDHFRIVDGDRLMWASPETTWDARPQPLRRGHCAPHRGDLPPARQGRDRGGIRRRGRDHRARHAADRTVAQRSVGRERFRPSGAEHVGDGGAMLIARSILWGDDRWRLFSPFELVWAGGATGRVAGHLIGMWGRGSSAAAGALARYREGARSRERIREARLAEANRQAGARSPAPAARRAAPGAPAAAASGGGAGKRAGRRSLAGK